MEYSRNLQFWAGAAVRTSRPTACVLGGRADRGVVERCLRWPFGSRAQRRALPATRGPEPTARAGGGWPGNRSSECARSPWVVHGVRSAAGTQRSRVSSRVVGRLERSRYKKNEPRRRPRTTAFDQRSPRDGCSASGTSARPRNRRKAAWGGPPRVSVSSRPAGAGSCARHVLDRVRRQRNHRLALLPSQQPLRGLLGNPLTGRLISHIFVAHPEEILESVTLGADMRYNRLHCPRRPPPDSWLVTKQFPE